MHSIHRQTASRVFRIVSNVSIAMKLYTIRLICEVVGERNVLRLPLAFSVQFKLQTVIGDSLDVIMRILSAVKRADSIRNVVGLIK